MYVYYYKRVKEPVDKLKNNGLLYNKLQEVILFEELADKSLEQSLCKHDKNCFIFSCLFAIIQKMTFITIFFWGN